MEMTTNKQIKKKQLQQQINVQHTRCIVALDVAEFP